METILIIDDYQPLLKLYEKEFKREGYQVVAVKSLNEAIHYMQYGSFDAVIVEIGALYRDELEILIHNLILGKKVPLIINTGRLDRFTKDWERQADAWVTKSSDLGPLKERIKVSVHGLACDFTDNLADLEA